MKRLGKQKACFENPGNPSCIDVCISKTAVCLKRDSLIFTSLQF